MLNLEQVTNKLIKISKAKAQYSIIKILLLGVLAGIFVSLGVIVRHSAVFMFDNSCIQRVIGGLFFPIGFLLIIFVGGELFTGNCLMILGVLNKDIKETTMIRNSVMVFLGNMIGAFIGAVLIHYSGVLDGDNGLIGGYLIKAAYNKIALTPSEQISSGIICNIIICSAIIVATLSKKFIDRFVGAWFIICCFAIAGFEHLVVNMYSLPAGLLASRIPLYRYKAYKIYGLSQSNMSLLNIKELISNYFFVTIGNLIGGVLLGVLIYCIVKKNSLIYDND